MSGQSVILNIEIIRERILLLAQVLVSVASSVSEGNT